MYTDGSLGFGVDTIIAAFLLPPVIFFFLPLLIITWAIYGIFKRANLETEWQRKLKKIFFFIKEGALFFIAIFVGLAIVLWSIAYFKILI